MNRQVEMAHKIAKKAHKSQFDRAGEPYFNHAIAVASMVQGDAAKAVAYLRDVLEDTDMDYEDLKGYGFDNEVLEAVAILTRSPNTEYCSYIASIKARDNKLAIEVKKADLRHNMDMTRLKKITKKDVIRQEKYLMALALLMGVDL